MKRLLMSLILVAANSIAATAYVSDELVLGVYSDPNQESRLATLHSGASVETLKIQGEFTQVTLSNGVLGWVKTSYLTNRIPASARIKDLEDELAKSRATTPALAAAAEHSELERLRQEVAVQQKQSLTRISPQSANQPPANVSVGPSHLASTMVFSLLGLGVGFALGYGTLARRIKQQFGGIKIY